MRVLAAVVLAAALGALQADGIDAPQAVSGVGAVGRAVALKLSPVAHSRNASLRDFVEGNLPDDLGGLVVKPGLVPGRDVQVDTALVAVKLRQGAKDGWSLRPDAPVAVTLKVPQLKLPGADLRKFAQDFVLERLSGTGGVSVEPSGLVQDLVLFDSPLKLKVRLPDGLALRGPVTLRVDVWQAGGGEQDALVASLPVSFIIRRQEGHLVTLRAIKRGERLGPENLALREEDATYEVDGVSSMDSVLNKVARTFIPEGKVLTQAMVDEPIAIQRGDVVRLLVKSGAVVVETSAKAMRDARIGESIPLQVIDTDRTVQARCVEPGVVVRDAP